MKNKIALKFAFKNLKANRLFLIPFFISSSIMGALFFVTSSLSQNKYIEKNQEYISSLLKFGTFIVAIFTLIFIIYANGFLCKRRNKEFALYGILGLEKKHISKIIFIEYIINFLIINIFSIIGGYILGKLLFVLLNKITRKLDVRIIDYKFLISSAILTFIFIGIIFIFIYLLTILKIGKSTPIELLSKQKKAEGEPKSKFFLGTLGILILCSGYYISITSKGIIKSFSNFFPAVILVIIGTYLVFIAFSILVLKLLKNNKNLYYKAKNFLSISGMLYRMKSNAISLASITIIATSIIVTLSSTLTINYGIKNSINSIYEKDFYIGLRIKGQGNLIEKGNNEKIEIPKLLQNILSENEKIKDLKIKKFVMNPVLNENGKIIPLGNKRALAQYLLIETLDEYNKNNNTNYNLNDDEVLYSTNSKSLYNISSLEFIDKKYNLIKIEDDIPKNLAVDAMKIVVKDDETFMKMIKGYIPEGEKYSIGDNYYLRFSFNTENVNETNFFEKLKINLENHYTNNKGITLESKQESSKLIYETYGGLLFLGLIVSLILITGVILITYYKQISEGFEDAKNYKIMKNVGLPNSIIRKTLRTQILWIFFLPLIFATINSIFAIPILRNILKSLVVISTNTFILSFVIVTATFSIIYFIIYSITSKVYYKIVK